MKRDGLFKKLVKLSVVPELLLGIGTMIFCFYRFTDILSMEAHTNMQNISYTLIEAYDAEYPGDYSLKKNAESSFDLYKGDTNITTDYHLIDTYKDITGMELSLLYKDLRIHTTFMTESKTRLAGLYTNSETAETVLIDNKEAFYKNIKILSDTYLVLYTPLKDSNGEVIGMIEVARNKQDLISNVWRAVMPILLIILAGVGIAVYYSTHHTREITGVIRKLQNFMNKVSDGALTVELDPMLIRRKDELGDISRASVSMQRSIRSFVGTDPLTGLNNRRYVQDAIVDVIKRSEATGTPYSIAIADIDFFKKVNDNYGHNAGDEVLKTIAGILKKEMVGKGFVARWGGEEFVLIFDKFNIDNAAAALTGMLDKIRATTISFEGMDIQVTMTMGVTDGFGDDLEKMVEVADGKLYYGKEHGRNQIVTTIPDCE